MAVKLHGQARGGMLYFLIAGLLFGNTLSAADLKATPASWEEAPAWGKHFEEAGVTGSFLLYDLSRNRYTVHKRERAQTSFLPASTFKILHSLIALEANAVSDEHEVFRWDGIDRGVPVWNRDHDMSRAFANSTVWFYQEIARRVGEARMRPLVRAAAYGNCDTSGGLDHFWLDGALRITSEEQIEFLVRLHEGLVPFSPRATEIVKRIMAQERGADWVLRAKSGWVHFQPAAAKDLPVAPQIGWFVGYVERGPDAYFFALNIDIHRDEDAPARAAITKTILRELNLLGEERGEALSGRDENKLAFQAR